MSIDVRVTDFGKALLVKALNNTCPILFTCMKFGNGDTPADYSVLTDLVNPLLTCPISDMEKGDNYIQLSSAFSNSDVASDFQLKEIGAFAMDQDGVTITPVVTGTGITAATVDHGTFMAKVEGAAGTYTFQYTTAWKIGGTTVNLADYGISVTGTAVSGDKIVVTVTVGAENLGMHLFAYVNQSSDPEPIYGSSSSKLKENEFSVVIVVDDAENVTATVKSLSYVTISRFEDHVGDFENPHQVTKTQVGLGNVPNVTTNNQTPTFVQAQTLTPLGSGETVNTLFGKLAKAVSDLIAHISNRSNPHQVTAAQVNAAAAAHTHAAGDVSSGTFSVARGGTGLATLVANALLYASSASAFSQVTKPSTPSYLRQDGNGAPYFKAISTLTLYHVGTTAPTETNLLWIDTTPVSGGLKYHDGSAWVHVPTAFTT